MIFSPVKQNDRLFCLFYLHVVDLAILTFVEPSLAAPPVPHAEAGGIDPRQEGLGLRTHPVLLQQYHAIICQSRADVGEELLMRGPAGVTVQALVLIVFWRMIEVWWVAYYQIKRLGLGQVSYGKRLIDRYAVLDAVVAVTGSFLRSSHGRWVAVGQDQPIAQAMIQETVAYEARSRTPFETGLEAFPIALGHHRHVFLPKPRAAAVLSRLIVHTEIAGTSRSPVEPGHYMRWGNRGCHSGSWLCAYICLAYTQLSVA